MKGYNSMKKLFTLALICCAAAAWAADVPAAAALDSNILKSGNFEGIQKGRYFGEVTEKGVAKGGWLTDNKYVTAPTDWVKLDKEVHKAAGQSLCIANPQGKDISVVQFFKLRKNTAYKLSFSIKTDVQKGSGSAFVMLNFDKNRSFPAKRVNRTQDWESYTVEFKTPENFNENRACYLRLYNYKLTGKVWFDCVKIEEIK